MPTNLMKSARRRRHAARVAFDEETMKGIILALSLALSVSPAVASGVAPISVKQEPKNYTPIPNKASTEQAQAWGYICRNGVWYCVMPYGGIVGTYCCGCGLCGQWSLW